jgi:hypothetical protein
VFNLTCGVPGATNPNQTLALRGVRDSHDRPNGCKCESPGCRTKVVHKHPGRTKFPAGYLYSEGKIAFDPSSSVTDAQFHSHTEVLAYVRSLDVGGKSAKFDVILPYSSFSAHGLVDGQPRAREMSGLGDPRFRFSVNLFGAPALSVKEFANYQQDLIVGISLQVSAPLGQYDNSKLLNLGNNRWSFRPELGISKAWGPWTVEVAPSVIAFTDNTDFFNGSTFAQAPISLCRAYRLQFPESGLGH